ncbi:GNAT family N-acetyltransferase [Flavobacterium sp.]|uniref:GNAT family N-acetyltransferase n=1 Tax=Flavobacterium sp. TaxID=239 RepID=UPI003D2DEFB8
MTVREATLLDYDSLYVFFKKIYRENHPLHTKEFWQWQYGDEKFGRSFICLNESNQIVGHVGANFGGGLAWIINVYLEEECRGKGILSKLYALARAYYPLAATAANEAGLGLYRNMRWIRYHDLVRFVKINPKISNVTIDNVCKPVNVFIGEKLHNETHYFKQPHLKGIKLNEDTLAVSQEEVGGLRMVDLGNLEDAENKGWEIGFNWMDYITSWNDLKIKELEARGWVVDYKSVVPWRLNPIEEGYFSDITFLSEEPLDKNFVVHRSFSDHGRIGSIKRI